MTTVNAVGIQASMGPWIVSSDQELTSYTTIQSAIDAALAATPSATEHHVVYVKAGTYTENLTLHPNVDLFGIVDTTYTTSAYPSTVKIIGHHTLDGTAGSNCACSNIYFTNTTANSLFAFTSAGLGLVVTFKNCNLNEQSGASNAMFGLTYGATGITVNLLNSYTASDYTLFSYSGTPHALAFNIVGGSLQTSTTQATSGTANNYTMTCSFSSIIMNINNTNSEIATFSFDKCNVQMAVTNATANFSLAGTFSNFTYFPTPTGSLAANALTFTNCSISDGASPPVNSTYLYGRPIISVSGTTKTFALSDAGTFQSCSNGSTQTLTVDTNANVAFPINTEIDIFQQGAGQVVIAAAGGVTIQSMFSNLKIAAQYSGATLKKLATNTWSLTGNLTA